MSQQSHRCSKHGCIKSNYTYAMKRKSHELSHNSVIIELFHARIIKQLHEISNNVVCATRKASDQPARSLIGACASRLNIL